MFKWRNMLKVIFTHPPTDRPGDVIASLKSFLKSHVMMTILCFYSFCILFFSAQLLSKPIHFTLNRNLFEEVSESILHHGLLITRFDSFSELFGKIYQFIMLFVSAFCVNSIFLKTLLEGFVSKDSNNALKEY